MAEAVRLQDRINEATRSISRSYTEALKAVEESKRRMNELELSISMKGRAKTSESMDRLNHEADKLDELTDSLILKSRTAWENYRGLEDDCRTSASRCVELDALKDLCKKTEQLAQDLLCYSLARFRRKDT